MGTAVLGSQLPAHRGGTGTIACLHHGGRGRSVPARALGPGPSTTAIGNFGAGRGQAVQQLDLARFAGRFALDPASEESPSQLPGSLTSWSPRSRSGPRPPGQRRGGDQARVARGAEPYARRPAERDPAPQPHAAAHLGRDLGAFHRPLAAPLPRAVGVLLPAAGAAGRAPAAPPPGSRYVKEGLAEFQAIADRREEAAPDVR